MLAKLMSKIRCRGMVCLLVAGLGVSIVAAVRPSSTGVGRQLTEPEGRLESLSWWGAVPRSAEERGANNARGHGFRRAGPPRLEGTARRRVGRAGAGRSDVVPVPRLRRGAGRRPRPRVR